MSVAGLLKQVTNGLQDERLEPAGQQPRIADIKSVLMKAGRFTTQLQRLDFERTPAFGQVATVEIPRKGHLVTRLWLVATLPDIGSPQVAAQALAESYESIYAGPYFNWTNSTGHALVERASMEIGGARVEQLDSRLLELLDEFYTPLEKLQVVNQLIRRNMTNFSAEDGVEAGAKQVVVPLPFWFSRGDAGGALPVDAINADIIRLSVNFRELDGMYYSDSRRSPLGEAGQVVNNLWPMAGSSFYIVNYSDGSVIPGLAETDPVIVIPDVTMPSASELKLGDTYILAEYVYLDKPEANRFRIADIQIPIVQHYPIQPQASLGASRVAVPLVVPNPVRCLYWMCQRQEAPLYNNWFLATRDLKNPRGSDPPRLLSYAPEVTTEGPMLFALAPANLDDPWWPDAAPLDQRGFSYPVPAFRFRDSEPVSAAAVVYEGSLVRWQTTTPQLYRSINPSMDCVKSPYVNRYYYMLPFSELCGGETPLSAPLGEANYDRITKRWLYLDLAPYVGRVDPNQVPNYNVYVWAETYNILRVFGGRAGLMFGY
jgi:hypothetical protein